MRTCLHTAVPSYDATFHVFNIHVQVKGLYNTTYTQVESVANIVAQLPHNVVLRWPRVRGRARPLPCVPQGGQGRDQEDPNVHVCGLVWTEIGRGRRCTHTAGCWEPPSGRPWSTTRPTTSKAVWPVLFSQVYWTVLPWPVPPEVLNMFIAHIICHVSVQGRQLQLCTCLSCSTTRRF